MQIQSLGSSLVAVRLPVKPKASLFFGVDTPKTPSLSSSSPEEPSDVDWGEVYAHNKARAKSPSQKSSSISTVTSQILSTDIPSPKGKEKEAPLKDRILAAVNKLKGILNRKQSRKPRKDPSTKAFRKWVAKEVDTTPDQVAQVLKEESDTLGLISGLTGPVAGTGSATTSTIGGAFGKRGIEQISLGGDNASRKSLEVDTKPSVRRRKHPQYNYKPMGGEYSVYPIRVDGQEVETYTEAEYEIDRKFREAKHRTTLYESLADAAKKLKVDSGSLNRYQTKTYPLQEKYGVGKLFVNRIPKKPFVPEHIQIGYDVQQDPKKKKAKSDKPATS